MEAQVFGLGALRAQDVLVDLARDVAERGVGGNLQAVLRRTSPYFAVLLGEPGGGSGPQPPG
ncbi:MULTISPECIES: hypothetical protein [unclassified Streptomyces]|uniref:hypothetical protein n=1 Tax=unclassified Streptomyces TaxID=2593676 RepID=UPI002B1E6A17|nr:MULTISPECIES: hypothetical protein [unclassified Streptomyces]